MTSMQLQMAARTLGDYLVAHNDCIVEGFEKVGRKRSLTPKGRAGFGSLLGHVMKGASSILPMPVRDRVGTIDENDETRVELSRSAQVRDV